jgi:hypothetical protein
LEPPPARRKTPITAPCDPPSAQPPPAPSLSPSQPLSPPAHPLLHPQDLSKDFETLDSAQKVVKLKAFSKFENTTEALGAATAIVDSKLPKDLKKFLKKHVSDGESLAVYDLKLGNLIKEKLEIACVHNQVRRRGENTKPHTPLLLTFLDASHNLFILPFSSPSPTRSPTSLHSLLS